MPSRLQEGALSNTWKWIVQGDALADEARYYWKGAAWEESGKVREPRRTALPLGSQSWVLWRRGLFLGCPCPITLLVSIYCLTQGFSRWHAALPVKTDSSREFPGGWQDILCMAQHLLPLFCPSQILRVGDSLSFPCSLLEPSRKRQLVQVVVFIPGQGRSFRSMVP